MNGRDKSVITAGGDFPLLVWRAAYALVCRLQTDSELKRQRPSGGRCLSVFLATIREPASCSDSFSAAPKAA
jgi:hypothetical protein